MSRPVPKHAPRVPFALLVLGLLVGGLVLLLMLNTASAANELRRHDLAAQDASVAAQVEQLHNEVAASAAPGNLARIAGQLGMVPAGNPAFLQIEPDGRVRVLGSAAPVTAAPVAPTKTATKTAARTGTKTAAKTPGHNATSTGIKSTGIKSTGTAATKSTKTGTAPSTPTPQPTTTLPGGTR
ncbi:hypothetical protein M6B22_20045 [Jatrophihabitans cynanchi]|jgi:hypothetical protein|uniref:Cell division protein FtsL n=1 Tax=Jatrophihabitans cynanchi TaxID=2944128 RepID=A0ABY7JWL8_9ACTN|nr:hypothetical protein [Jatrophihabitans sp. SB3-54]WAX56794.1 hypothetical protein M6B22_20045 [Jatrophihabitans sp. SB3-54]